MTTDVFLSGLQMALGRLCVNGDFLLHSDRGSQYCRAAFQAALARHEIRCSMSRKGNCWDNAVSESFFASLKKELVYQHKYASREEARQSIVRWIETFYNRTRLHSTLGSGTQHGHWHCRPGCKNQWTLAKRCCWNWRICHCFLQI
jgi:putative transposase